MTVRRQVATFESTHTPALLVGVIWVAWILFLLVSYGTPA